MPIEKIKKYYGCKFKCGQKHSLDRDWIIVHEELCFANPGTKSCKTCKHSDFIFETVYNPYHGGDPGSTDYEEQRWYCNKDIKDYPTSDCKLWENKKPLDTGGGI